jgi:predicted nuclease of predicted toxin-antitoxin system
VKLKLEENLGKRGLALFAAAGYEAATVAGQGLRGEADQSLIEHCHGEQRCLVTLDLDFSNPLVFDPEGYSGIAVLRLPSQPTPDDLLDRCRTLIAALMNDDIVGKLWIVQKDRIREYRPDRPGEGGLV